jgi:hypothetical protein
MAHASRTRVPTQCLLPRSDPHSASGRDGRKTEAIWPEADCLLPVAMYGEADTTTKSWSVASAPLPPFTERLPNDVT